jgi:hypothetical protein
VPVLQQLVRTPRVSGHVAAGPIYFYSSTVTVNLLPTLTLFSNPLRHWSPATGMRCMCRVDEGVTGGDARMYSTVQYACLFPTPLEHWSLATGTCLLRRRGGDRGEDVKPKRGEEAMRIEWERCASAPYIPLRREPPPHRANGDHDRDSLS